MGRDVKGEGGKWELSTHCPPHLYVLCNSKLSLFRLFTGICGERILMGSGENF